MLRITGKYSLKEIYDFQLRFQTPYFFQVSFEEWKKSFESDCDGEGRNLFNELNVKVIYEDDSMAGFVQYGKTAFGFDNNGEISEEISYPVIRNLYFSQGKENAGRCLLDEAVKDLKTDERIYAFFHYYGMSCFARHGKLFEKHPHIDALLREKGFSTEHENVYYSSVIDKAENSEIAIIEGAVSEGFQQCLDFFSEDRQVGGCQVHYINGTTAYLRWIYVNGDITGKGIGTKCMVALKGFLYAKGVERFDTDTALDNRVAQHYYEKNGFIREGITRSYHLFQPCCLHPLTS